MTPIEVGVLSVGAGDTKLTFDPNSEQDKIRAARIIKDMLRRGYSLLIKIPDSDPPKYTRAYDFDENTCEYIIADFDPTVEMDEDAATSETNEQEIVLSGNTPNKALQRTSASPTQPESTASTSKRKRQRTRRVSATRTQATAVPRTAGG